MATTVTNAGMALNTRLLLDHGVLSFSRVAAGIGADPATLPQDMTALPGETYPALDGMSWARTGKDTEIKIEAILDNAELTAPLQITCVGLYANDPDSGKEILYAVDTLFGDPIIIPAFEMLDLSTHAHRHIFQFFVEIARGLEIKVEFIAYNYLTLEEADGRYWKIGTKYPATEITESVGRTVEEHQRWQDDQLAILNTQMESGATNALQAIFDAARPLKWKIIDDRGWYDANLAAFRCGSSEFYLPDEAPPVEPEPDPETTGGDPGTSGANKRFGKR